MSKVSIKGNEVVIIVCYRTQSYLGSFGTYRTGINCCPGYGGLNCTGLSSHAFISSLSLSLAAKCESPECNDNEICIAPNHCSCIEGWTGYRCLTGTAGKRTLS